MKALSGSAVIGALAVTCSLWAGVPARAADQVRIAIPAADNPLFVPLRAAVELGFFKKQGIDATVTAFRGGGAEQAALAAGAIDIMHISPASVGLVQDKGVKEKCVFGLGGADGWYLAVAADSKIKSVKELAGGSVGISSKGSTSDLYALWAIKRAGISAKTVPLGGSATMVSALKQHEIAATILWPTLGYQLLLSHKARSLVDFGKEMPPVPSCLVATDSFIQQKPDVLRRALKAVGQTISYLKTHKKDAIAQIEKLTGVKDQKVLNETFNTIIMDMDPSGHLDAKEVQNSLDLAALAGIKIKASASDIFTDKFLPTGK